MTQVLELDPERPQQDAIKRAASIIRDGGLVAFPTETVYGLGADAMNENAVLRIFEAKGRPSDNPCIVHVASRRMLDEVSIGIDAKAERLIKNFWPGPLTLVLGRKADVPSSVSAGLSTIAVRMPNNRIALELIEAAGVPVAAPSANSSGRPSPTTATHVFDDLAGRIDLILDGGDTKIGIESTVLDMTSDPPIILRPGWITKEMLRSVIGAVGDSSSEEDLRRSPGTRHRHYSPRARVILIEYGTTQQIEKLCVEHLNRGSVGFIGHSRLSINNESFYPIYLEAEADKYAHSIYSALREIDSRNPEIIIVEGINNEGLGASVMDRLRRAAS
ncbi:MAG TPA: L-threonylcarbamoyladenylate synthase [Blastocatellia bacterium]|nr:L-threonylcarbamoyladenylate synthase [Blastocatellia bacterium]